MSTIIGTIKTIIGQAWVVASDGTRRQATEGEQIMRGEVVMTDHGAVTITLPNGRSMDLGRSSQWGEDAVSVTPSEHMDDDALLAAQQAIAEGADPTQVLESTAAGNNTIIDSTSDVVGSQNGHTHVILDLTGKILDPTAGYPTEGLDNTSPLPPEEITLLEPDAMSNAEDKTPEMPLQPLPPEASITIDVIAGDNVINMKEAAEATTRIGGSTGKDVKPGDHVTVTVNGHEYKTTVMENGGWSVDVNTQDLLASGDVVASVTTYDQYGNEATSSAQTHVNPATLDITITLDPVSEDGILNNADLAQQETALSGTVTPGTPIGTVITLTLNGEAIGTATVSDADGHWHTTVPTESIAGGGEVKAYVTLSDEYGNTVDDFATTPVTPHPLHIDITLDPVSEDGILNNADLAQQETALSGTVTPGTPIGTVITLTLNGEAIGTATVSDADGHWHTTVPTESIAGGGEVKAYVTLSDEYGNTVDDFATTPVTPHPLAVGIEIDHIHGDDDYLSDAELQTLTEGGNTLTLTGTVSGDAKMGDKIFILVNGEEYETEVGENNTWQCVVDKSHLVLDQNVISAKVSISDNYGNAVSANTDTTFLMTDPQVEISIDPITGDNFLSFDETNHNPGEEAPTTQITGKVSGDASLTDTITVTIGQETFKDIPLEYDAQGNLVWHLDVDTSLLVDNPQVKADITITDIAGNSDSASSQQSITVETANVIKGDEFDNTLSGGDASDIVIADTIGLQTVAGQDYNIAFLVDTSGSVGDSGLKSIIASLEKVFESLISNANDPNYGTINVLLIDFDSGVKNSVALDLSKPEAFATLKACLDTMIAEGGTNYKDAFEAATNWFKSMGSSATNLTYFISDGVPTQYFTDKTQTTISVSNYTKLTIANLNQWNFGDSFSTSVKWGSNDRNSGTREVIDQYGNVYSWSGTDSRTVVGKIEQNAKGEWVFNPIAGKGNTMDAQTKAEADAAFKELDTISNVEGLGIGNNLNKDVLKDFDSDGSVQTGIAPDKLAEAIMGGGTTILPGANDTVQGGAGQDILFGDVITFDGVSGNGYSALQSFIAAQMGLGAAIPTDAQMHEFMTENPDLFDMSNTDGGRDLLLGGTGNDLIYGGGGDDLLFGGAGHDTLYGGDGNDVLFGDGVNDLAGLRDVLKTNTDFSGIDDVADQDINAFLAERADALQNLMLAHPEAFENSQMAGGNDILKGGAGNDLLFGGGGNDTLYGGTGNDTLHGGSGNDILVGGQGSDMLFGGEGADTFRWLKGDDGHDVIKDFNAAEGDRIDLSDLLSDMGTDIASYIKVSDDNNGNALIEINTSGKLLTNGSTMSITVENCSSADINIDSLLAKPESSGI